MEVIVGSSLLAVGAEKQGNIVNFQLDLFCSSLFEGEFSVSLNP